ncbi:MAG TPA: serine protease [Iamia sp.]|jgi:S1-C subfamily serine protease|nr:serine protease [Iamia sp.]
MIPPSAVARRAGAVLATAALVVLGSGCVAPPSEPEVDTSAIDAPVEVDPGLYTVRIRSQTCEGLGVGSGFLIDGTTIVTNRHVVEGADTLEVETSEGENLTVDVANQGLLADLAVVRLVSSMEDVMGDTPHATLAPVNPEPGDEIRAYGYPEGGVLTVTEGEVEDYVADPQLGNLSKVIRSEVEIHPGNSGGPAINERNQVVGVVYAIEVATEKSLIVPVDTLQRLLEDDEGVETVQGC